MLFVTGLDILSKKLLTTATKNKQNHNATVGQAQTLLGQLQEHLQTKFEICTLNLP